MTIGAFDASERDVLERIAGGAPLVDVLERIVRLVERQAPGMCCSILLLDREQRCVRYGAAPSLPAEYSRAIDGAPIGPAAGSCGTAAFLGERVIVEDIAVHPYWTAYKHLALPHGLRACWSSPIFSTRHEVLGTFAMYYREPRGPLAEEIAWVDAATHLAAIAIGHEVAAQALRRSEAHYRRIADTAHEGIWLLDTAGGTLFANLRLAEMLRCRPDEMPGTTIFDFLDAAAGPEIERKLASPLPGGAEQYDVCLHSRDGTEVWAIVSSSAVSDDDGRLVGTLAMVTDITERKEAEARTRRIARLYAVSSSVNEAIVRVRDTQELYERACRIAVEQGLLRLAWVGIYDDVGKTFRPVARFGADDGYVDHITLSMDDDLMNRGPAGRALRTGLCAVEDDIASATDFYWKDEALARGLRSCAAFPLTITDRPVGVLLLYADRPAYFRDEELRVLGALADDISFAVASAVNEVERRRLVHDLGERVKELDTAASHGQPAADRPPVRPAVPGRAGRPGPARLAVSGGVRGARRLRRARGPDTGLAADTVDAVRVLHRRRARWSDRGRVPRREAGRGRGAVPGRRAGPPAIPGRHAQRPCRSAAHAGPAAAGPEDPVARDAGGRHRPRLQQRAGRGRGQCRAGGAGVASRSSACTSTCGASARPPGERPIWSSGSSRSAASKNPSGPTSGCSPSSTRS